ncbi:hypothetical protein DFH08DRAFT_988527 [Mycena albidolilacea]|uniref:Ubiquitin-like domain-containing protein n=1 Tax=Mycena albidolilacea TaxID=1033008 RepID=A0AAD6Z0H6_9AGAR|nr:hypothetical protein DFH08DRAFT_988527 [Mycena albidolilacea]
MPRVAAFALAYGSFGDIQATLALAYKLYVIFHNSGLGELSGEAQNVLKVLHTFHEDTAARMQYLENDSPLALSADTQRIADKICTELQSCASLMAKLKDKVSHCNGFWVGVLWVVSKTQALVAWRVEMENHRRNVNAYLESLLVVGQATQASNAESHTQQLENMGSEMGLKCVDRQTGRSEFEFSIRVNYPKKAILATRTERCLFGTIYAYWEFKLRSTSLSIDTKISIRQAGFEPNLGPLISTTADRIASQISITEIQLQQFMQSRLHDISMATFSVSDPLGRPISIDWNHCRDFNALDLILKAYMFNRPEAGADCIERGDYDLVRPEGSIILCVDSPRAVKPGSQFDMNIIKRPMEFHRPDLEECPYCNQKKQQVTVIDPLLWDTVPAGNPVQNTADLSRMVEFIRDPQADLFELNVELDHYRPAAKGGTSGGTMGRHSNFFPHDLATVLPVPC